MAPDREREGGREDRETVAEALQGIRRDIESPTLLKDFSVFPKIGEEEDAPAPPQAGTAPETERKAAQGDQETLARPLRGIRRDIESPTPPKGFSAFPEAGEAGDAPAPPQAGAAPETERKAAQEDQETLARPLEWLRRDMAASAGAGPGGVDSREVFVLTEVVEPAGSLLLDSRKLDDVVARRTRREVRRWLESNLPGIVREAVAREMRSKGAGDPS